MNNPNVAYVVSIPLSLRKRAFSLVEVMIALGVIGFALTTLIRLMPLGLNMFRESITSTVQTDVLRLLALQFQEPPFASLSNSTNMLDFSDQTASMANILYVAPGVH